MTGEWKINCDGYYPYCSRCGYEPKGGLMSNFCPNCGADMKKEKTSEIEKRYKHLLKEYGRHDPYVCGFVDCMNIVGGKND